MTRYGVLRGIGAALVTAAFFVRPAAAQQTLPSDISSGLQTGAQTAPKPSAKSTDAPTKNTEAPRKVIAIHLRAAEALRQPDGTFKEKEHSSPIVSTVEGKSGKVSVGGPSSLQSFDVLPSVNADGTITVHVVWHEEKRDRKPGGEQTRITNEAAFTRRLAAGVPVSVSLFDAGDFRYFVEVSASVQPTEHPATATP